MEVEEGLKGINAGMNHNHKSKLQKEKKKKPSPLDTYFYKW